MATIVTRTGKGSALTFAEGDANFTNLNDDKLEASGGTITGYKETIHSLGTTDTPTINVANGNVQTITITSGLTLPAFTSASTGQSVTLLVTGSGTASGTAAYKFAGGNTTLTTLSVISIFYDGTNYFTSIATDFQ
jgi:hypothetical protein